MPIKPATAKIIDLDTTVEAVPSDTAEGPIVWATVRMEYTLAGLAPLVSIRVPIPYQESDSEQERRGQALRCARELIDHACRAAGVGPTEPKADANLVEQAIESVIPPALGGIAQELGLAKPSRQPRRERGRKENA